MHPACPFVIPTSRCSCLDPCLFHPVFIQPRHSSTSQFLISTILSPRRCYSLSSTLPFFHIIRPKDFANFPKVARAVSPTPQPLSIIPDHRSAQPLRSALKPATTTHPAGSRGARLDRAHHRHERKVRGDAKSVVSLVLSSWLTLYFDMSSLIPPYRHSMTAWCRASGSLRIFGVPCHPMSDGGAGQCESGKTSSS